MALEYLALGPTQCGLYCLHLIKDVDTLAIVLDHLRDAAHLSFDPAKTIDDAGTIGC